MRERSILNQDDIQTAISFIDRLEKRGRYTPKMIIFASVMSLLLLFFGVRELYQYRMSIQPGPNILERLDAVPSDQTVPVLLRVSGESRKGLMLVQLEAQMRAMDAAMVSMGFTIFVLGVCGISFVYTHRRDGTRDMLLAKLLRSYIADIDNQTDITPP